MQFSLVDFCVNELKEVAGWLHAATRLPGTQDQRAYATL